MHRRIRQNAGFTLIELLVTMVILGLMLFLLNQLFNDTSNAITRGVQNSKVIATARSVNEQVQKDGAAMIGPLDPANAAAGDVGGYLVIIQQQLPVITMLDPFNLGEVEISNLRADQIAFIRDAEGLRSMTPQNASSYGSNLVGQRGDVARVWYGIVQRTQPDGRRGQVTAEYLLGGGNAGLDRIGSNFILGRQALLFNPSDELDLAQAVPRADSTVAGAPAQYTYADTASYRATVRNTGAGPPQQTYMGLSDVTVQEYGPATDPNSLLFSLTDSSFNVNVQRNNYLETVYRIAAQRLRVNPSPDPAGTDFRSWAIAQGHGIFAQNCSEFIVDFAADLNANGRIDVVFGGTPSDLNANRAIEWYDALRQPNLGDGSGGTTRGWDRPGNGIQPFQAALSTNDVKIFIFRVEDDIGHPSPATANYQANSSWPYLVRIRYRLHDTRGRLTSNNQVALADGLDNNGNGIADEIDEDKYAGRWFETIIRVPRPDPGP